MKIATWSADTVRSRLERLPPSHAVAFAASCCERLLPNYAAFSRTEKWGNTGVLRKALDCVWQGLEEGRFNRSSIEDLISAVGQQIPDTEDFASAYTSAALDAGAAIVHTLQCSISGDVDEAVQAASLAHDTVHMHLQASRGLNYTEPDFDETIYSHPLMVRELKHQESDLEALARTPILTPDFLLRLRVSSEDKSSIELLAGFPTR